MMPSVEDLITYLLPFVLKAGDYSARIQKSVGTHEAKEGATAFHHALSDADLTIQSYVEVALLAKYPEVSFFCEERAQSLNAKYFTTDASLEVLLDPIDGTRAYIDGRAQYQIICVIHDKSEIVGAVCFMPRRDMCYVAMKGQGARLLSHADVREQKKGTPLSLERLSTSGPVLVFNSPDLVERLSPQADVRDLLLEYNEGEDRGFSSTDVVDGRASAYVMPVCQAIDGGALAFIAQEMGAIVTDFEGKPVGSYRESPDRVATGVVVATTKELHAKLLSSL
jgi:myo-inositol-1(or 4)-monophosphatase